MKRVYTVNERIRKENPIFCWQKVNGNYLATSGSDQVVHIYDRHGEPKERISLPGMCVAMEWDKDGDIFATICDQSPMIYIWNSNTGRNATIDTGLRDTLSLLIWSKGAPVLAVGTNKGNLLIYNHQTSRKVPVLGKHSKKITCGAWSHQNLLALGSDDRTLTVSNTDGDNVRQCNLRKDISLVQFSEMKQDERNSGQNTVSLILDQETLYLYNIYDPDNPIELAFQPKYGKIKDYQWFGDGYIVIGFSIGFFIGISTHMKEIGQELFQVRNHKDYLSSIAVCHSMYKAASVGDNSIRIHELQDFESIYAIATLDDESRLDKLGWTDDGQLLAVSTNKGNIHVYLTKLPILGDVCGSQLVYLTSLLEVSIYDKLQPENVCTLKTDVEPGFLALGPYHMALGMNNCAWFYLHSDEGFELLFEKQYVGTIREMKLNSEYVAVLFDGKVQLHTVENNSESDQKEAKIFPSDDDDDEESSSKPNLASSSSGSSGIYKVTCISLSHEFLIYGTNSGTIYFFYMKDWMMVNEYRHTCCIVKVFPDNNSSRLIFIDEKTEAYVYNPINDDTLTLPDFTSTAVSVIWESWPPDKNVFIVHDDESVYTYVHWMEYIEGSRIDLVGKTKLPQGQHPKMLYSGEVICQTQSSKITTLVLVTHGIRDKISDYQPVELRELLIKDLQLGRFDDAWITCQLLNDPSCWTELAKSAVKSLQVDFAIKVYRQIKNVGMVWSLKGIEDIEDRNLLSGHLAMLLNNYNLAQDHYLNSCNAVAALEMRRDLLHWDQALQLANKLAPDQIPFISREYAMQLEFVGDYSNALLHYEKGLVENDDGNIDHNNVCNAGVARMSIRCGDVRRGTSIALDMENRQLKRECAEILENMKQLNEAATLYEKSNYYDKAASLYIRLKSWNDVKSLLPNITSHKLFGQYAKAKEVDRSYDEAVKAYEAAQDYDNVVRIYLDHLNNPDEAVRVVKESKSVEGAKMVARFFQKLNDYSSAIKFLVMSKCNDEAFQMAQSHNIMDLYADVIAGTDDATPDNYRSIAVHFESGKNLLMAGKFYYLAGSYNKAMKHLLKAAVSEDSQAMQLAIDTAGAANDNRLTRQLIDFLMGEHDGIPKDFKYIFRLYMTLKQYKEAAKTAVIIAREEQNAGNYRNAHDLLFSMYQELKKNNIKIPSEMKTNLMIIHSYILVKIHVKRGEHLKGARMLIRVANNISRFPSHVVPMLTSTVIECHRSGLKNSSFSYAAMLVRPEYRNKIDLKYKKKIEGIVRKPTKSEEDEPNTPCPYCNVDLAETELFCPECKHNIPYCIVTGRHLIKDDLTVCPRCEFPAIKSEFFILLNVDDSCPMCSERVEPNQLETLQDQRARAVLYQDEDDIENSNN